MPPKQDEFLLSSSASPPISARLVIDDKRVIVDNETHLTTTSPSKDSLTTHFEASALRASRLAYLLEQQHAGDGRNLTIAACQSSLQTKFPTVLHQTSLLVDSWRATSSDHSYDRMVAKIRSTLGLHRMDQYLDKIELTMSCLKRETLGERLGEIMDSLRAQGAELGHDAASTDYECCVSPLHGASSLFFDLAVGPTVTTKVDAVSKKCPLEAEVQPVIELYAQDLIQGRVGKESVRAYSIEIESCKHYAEQFHSSAGWTGEACIRLRLRSSVHARKNESRHPQEWTGTFHHMTVERDMIRVKEVTV